MPKILVHEKALAHLSRGLYRSPASALRELVSNSWDANATEVRIGTNYPLFYQLSVADNGDGFTRKEFEKIMGGGIGNSTKRSETEKLKYGRPVIGRLGIGMLGIAQICGSFIVTSKPRKGQGFRARVKLFDLLREKLDSNDELVIKTEEVDVGEYFWEEYDESSVEYGTSITSEDVHPTFIRSFQNSLKFESFKEPPLDWEKAVKIVSGVHSLQELGDYWRLLWELAASCPVPYISDNVLPNKLIGNINKKLKSYHFRVVIDGIDLKKPVYLKNNPGGYTTYSIEEQSKTIYGKSVDFEGYLLVQEGTQLHPDELRGIMIRVRNIGIGYYDQTMLDYRFNEGPRSRWLTGEIYVNRGLENALNIDRDSFNRFHPEFRYVQEFIHEKLRSKIFAVSYRKIEERSNKKKETVSKTRSAHLKNVISEHTSLKVNFSKTITRDKSHNETKIPSVAIRESKSQEIIVDLPKEDTLKTKKSYRQLAVAILAIFEIALREKELPKKREVFSELLLKLLEEW
ncbi:MAG: ATP-binding protein [Chloroflexota bacterium]